MNAPNIAQLNKKFSWQKKTNSLLFETGQGDIPIVAIQNEGATARISLQGAHLLSWKPKNQSEVIWVSNQAIYAEGKAIRGGIPICWPWFGAHEGNADYPAHGFARIEYWQVLSAESISAEETQITFGLDTSLLNQDRKHLWPWPTQVEYCFNIGKTLSLEVTTINNSDQSIRLGQALHTYFDINDIKKTTVKGLQGKSYLDKTKNYKRETQVGPISIATEVDRVYEQTADEVIIDNGTRKILIKKQGSQSTIVWNPWLKVAKKMADFGDKEYLNMLCVESANAAEDTVIIPPGERHKLHVRYDLM